MNAKDIYLYTIIHVEVISLRKMKIIVKPDAILTAITRRGLTLYGVAIHAGISPTHMYNLMSGRRNASPKVAMAIARVLRVDPTDIFHITYREQDQREA